MNPPPVYPATTLRATYAACNLDQPLDPDDPRCVDLTEARGGASLAASIAWSITATEPGSFHRQLLTGHRGSGKSTEIKQLQALLRGEGFYAVYFDAFDILDPADVEHVDVLLSIAQAVYDDIRKTEIQLDAKLLESLESWFHQTILTHEDRADIEASLKTEVGVEVKIPTLLRLFTTLTGQLKASSARRREIRETLDRQLRVFLERLNELLNDVQAKLAAEGWKGLVVLVDNLEKIPYQVMPNGETNHALLFMHHAEQLKAPNCHLVYTVPVSLVFNANLGADYDDVLVIPMVKVKESDGVTDCATGRDALLNLVARRAAIGRVFESAELVHRLITTSGGVVRDLLRLVRFACWDAGRRAGGERIDEAAVDFAVRELAVEYERLIQQSDLDRLGEIGRVRFVAGDETLGRLLFNRLVLEYRNHEHWYNLHPLIRASRHLRPQLEG